MSKESGVTAADEKPVWAQPASPAEEGVLLPAGAVVEAAGAFFQHVHWQECGVFDFTEWVGRHPGGAVAGTCQMG